MSQKARRYSLKSKEAKAILNEASAKLKLNINEILGPKVTMEVVESESIRLFLVNGKPLLFRNEPLLLPTLTFSEALEKMPKVVVDMGAVPYVCKGADVMAPGIVRVEGEFSHGELVAIADVKHLKWLGLGESLQDSSSVNTTRKGVVVKNLHYVSDRFWQLTKAFSDS